MRNVLASRVFSLNSVKLYHLRSYMFECQYDSEDAKEVVSTPPKTLLMFVEGQRTALGYPVC
jgi:hypothetical protein